MAGTVIIKDGTTTKYTFDIVKRVQHLFERSLNIWPADGESLPPVDDNKTVKHVIIVDFELTNDASGTIWQKKASVEALKQQATNANGYYTLIEEDDTEQTTGYPVVIQKILLTREQSTKNKLTGTLVCLETDDVYLI